MKKTRFSLILVSAIAMTLSLSAKNQQQCEDMCYDKAGKMKYGTQSGSTSKSIDKCLDACRDLGDAQEEFRKCISNAHSQADKEACREEYRNNRPDI